MRLLVLGKSGQVAHSLGRLGTAETPVVCWGRETLDLAAGVAVATRFQALLERQGPFDAVINAAAYTAVDRAEEEREAAFALNAAAPAALARVCHQAGLPFLHLSTDYVFDGSKKTPYKEDDPTAPQGVYGASKLAGEEAVMAACPAALIFRTAWVYGAHGHNFVKTMVRLQARERLTVVADQIGNPTSADDIANALIAIVRHDHTPTGEAADKTGVFHLAATGSTSWHGFAEAIFALTRTRPRVDAITTEEYPTPAKRPANSRLACDRLKDVFGVELPYWRHALQQVMAQLS